MMHQRNMEHGGQHFMMSYIWVIVMRIHTNQLSPGWSDARESVAESKQKSQEIIMLRIKIIIILNERTDAEVF